MSASELRELAPGWGSKEGGSAGQRMGREERKEHGGAGGTSSPGPKACDLRLQQSHSEPRPPSSQLPLRLASSSWSQGSWQVLDPSGARRTVPCLPVDTRPSTASPGPKDRPCTGSPQQLPACVGTARPRPQSLRGDMKPGRARHLQPHGRRGRRAWGRALNTRPTSVGPGLEPRSAALTPGRNQGGRWWW